MKKIAAESLVERLADWGVDTIFGLPGDGINGLFEALRRHQDRIRFVLVHHEEAAAFMACAYAKTTGRLGVCIATSGPGGVHLLNGLYDAKLDHQPVLAITGMQETSLLGTGYQQEVHLEKLYENVADYDVMVTNPASVATLTDLAVKHALTRRTVSHLTFPNDLLGYPEFGVRHSSVADYAPWAASCGGYAAKVDKASELDRVVGEALAHDGPALVDCDVDPDEPPMPGTVSYEQAKHFAQAFLRGQPRRVAIATTLFKDKLQQRGWSS